MATKQATTRESWLELERQANALIPADISRCIPVRVTDEGRTVRIADSQVTLPVLVGMYRQGDSVEVLVNECFPHLEQDDVQAVVDYCESNAASWIDEYITILYAAAELRHEDFKKRWESGEFSPQPFNASKQ